MKCVSLFSNNLNTEQKKLFVPNMISFLLYAE